MSLRAYEAGEAINKQRIPNIVILNSRKRVKNLNLQKS